MHTSQNSNNKIVKNKECIQFERRQLVWKIKQEHVEGIRSWKSTSYIFK